MTKITWKTANPRIRPIFRIIFILWIVITIGCSFSQAQSTTIMITILHSNDFHGADMELLAKRATIIKQIRAEGTQSVLILDAGDIFGRGPYAKKFYGELEFAIFNSLQYDAVTLGNNEFKATEDLSSQKILIDRVNQAKFPVLCANAVVAENGRYLPGIKPYIIKELSGIRIAIFGVTTPKITSYRQFRGWKYLDYLDTSKNLVAELKSKSDIIIALTHIGFDLDRVLAENVPGLAAIVGGDSHTILLKPLLINGTPIVQAGDNGYYLGRLDLTFEKTETGWVLRQSVGKLISLDNDYIKPDPDTEKIIQEYFKRLKKAQVNKARIYKAA